MDNDFLTIDELHAAVRASGVPSTADMPASLPQSADAQWGLLAPYVGRPLRDIPATLVLLFTADNQAMNGDMLADLIRALPARERMVVPTGDAVFI